MTLKQKLDPNNGPKRILSCDGGGIRGALSLGYLQKIEDILKERHPHIKNFVLADYFDLIGGTSTGAIIASALSIGMSVGELKEKYFSLGTKIFGHKNRWWNIFETKDFLKAGFDHKPLENELKNVFGDIQLNDANRIKTGLCIVSKRADTNSVWPIINHPDGKYFDTDQGQNGKIYLRDAIRASAAAPGYFLPITIDVGQGVKAAFVDGGVSMANNPSLQLLMVATLNGFPFHWKKGADNLLIVSVGTGMSKMEKLPQEIESNILLDWAKQVPDMLMQDASWQNQALLQWISKSPTPSHIDGEIGDLSLDSLADEPIISYLRYNAEISEKGLTDLNIPGEKFDKKRAANISEMSNAENCEILYKIGASSAAVKIKADHFPELFNLPKTQA